MMVHGSEHKTADSIRFRLEDLARHDRMHGMSDGRATERAALLEALPKMTTPAPVLKMTLGGWLRPATVDELHMCANWDNARVTDERAREWAAYDASVCVCHDSSAYRPTHPRVIVA